MGSGLPYYWGDVFGKTVDVYKRQHIGGTENTIIIASVDVERI